MSFFLEKVYTYLSDITGFSENEIDLTFTKDHLPYHLSTSIALKMAKKEGEKPLKISETILNKISSDPNNTSYFDEVKITKPGFLNFRLSKNLISDEFNLLLSVSKNKLILEKLHKKKFLVEFSSPNIAKPFSIGHARSTIIGNAFANLLESLGADVYRDNHLGDWGTQFGKLLYYIVEKKGGIDWFYEIEKQKKDPVIELFNLYVEFHKDAEGDSALEDKAREWFKKLEEGDELAKKIWEKCVSLSLSEFQKIYDLLGITFSENEGKGLGESYFSDKTDKVIDLLSKKGLLKEGEDGAKLVFFDDLPPLMILKKDGTSLYATRDLAADIYRKEKYKDITIINEVGSEQSLYFKQLFQIEQMLSLFSKDERIHLSHGHFRFKDKKMSTRKGEIVFLIDVLKECLLKVIARTRNGDQDKVIESNDPFNFVTEDEKRIAIGALLWNELKRDPQADVIFNWDEMLSLKGNTGSYLQYSAVRAQSILTKTKGIDGNLDFDLMYSSGLKLIDLLIQFRSQLLLCYKEYSLNSLSNYLYKLANEFNSWYEKERVIGSKDSYTLSMLVKATHEVLISGLLILGIKVPSKM